MQHFVDHSELDAQRLPALGDPLDCGPEALTIHVERVEGTALIRYHAAWSDLCARALEPNVFLEPAFALPLIQHVRSPERPSYLLVWAENGPTSFGRLLGLFPVVLPRGALALGGLARGFAHKQTACGTPLVDRHRAREAIDAALTWLDTHGSAGLLFTNVARDGPFHAEIDRFCTSTSRRLVKVGAHERAVLRRPDDRDGRTVLFASAKRRKERVRQFRRLSEVGARTYGSAQTPAAIATATERFLALEHNGWKGSRGTALLADPTLATFVRTMTRLLGHDGKCRIDSIDIDGRPVAMGIVIKTADRAYFWKTAFDEAYASLSPGVQFAIDLTQAQLADPTVALTDSCAVANHPMIDKLWPNRIAITDIILAVRPGDTKRFAWGVAIERVRRDLRRRAKALWVSLRARARH